MITVISSTPEGWKTTVRLPHPQSMHTLARTPQSVVGIKRIQCNFGHKGTAVAVVAALKGHRVLLIAASRSNVSKPELLEAEDNLKQLI